MEPQDENLGQLSFIPRKPRIDEDRVFPRAGWCLRRNGQKVLPMRLNLNEVLVVFGSFAVPIFGRSAAAGVRTEGAGVFRIVRFVR